MDSPRAPRLYGARRLADGAGMAASLVLSLFASRARALELAHRLTERTWNAKLFATIVQGVVSGDEKCGVTQFYVFAVVMTFAVAAGLAFAGVLALANRWREGRWLGLVLDALVVAIAVISSFKLSPFTGRLALGVVVLGGATVAGYCGRGHAPVRPASDRTQAAIVLGAEALAVAWTAWYLGRERFGVSLAAPLIGLLVLVAARVGRARPSGDPSLVLDALAGLPLLALPFVGLLRDPSVGWLVAAIVLVALARPLLRALPRPRLPEVLASTIAPACVAAILLLPLRFRELGHVSHFDHEGQHLGWLESALGGKLLIADAGFIYGPVREYLLGAVAWAMGGLRLDHIRLAHVFLNLVGVAFLFHVGWRFVHRRFWPFALWWWFVLARTPAWYFLGYPDQICFGWADDARAAYSLFAMMFAFEAIERLPSVRPTRRSLRPLFIAGVLAALSLLYSQDCGVAVVAATGLCLGADALLRRRALGLKARVQRALFTGGAFTAGVALVMAIFIGFYVAMGRGPALLEFVRYEAVLGTGMSFAASSPLSAADFADSGRFLGRVDFYVPLFATLLGAIVVIASVVRGGWTARTPILTGLTLFSAVLFRYGLMRADRWHIFMAAIPAYLIIAVLVADATAFAPVVRLAGRWRVPLNVVLLGGLTLAALVTLDRGQGIAPRVDRIWNGEERPSTGPAYHYDDIPRAGDEHVGDDTLQLVRFIRQNTTPNDPIWVVTHVISGGELYFLSDRRDPTPFDINGEVVTTRDTQRAMEAITRKPPLYIIGHGYYYTPETTAFVEKHWKLMPPVAGIKIRRYDPSSF